ncbi:MAG: retroviral-like aspartic protease family protein [Magnetococcus sp. YQC-5]
MPLTDAGFLNEEGRYQRDSLLWHGPSIQVIVGHMQFPDIPTPEQFETVHALIDTGATESCIDAGLAERLQLPVVDLQPMSGIAGPTDHYVYLARVSIPSLDFTQYGRFTAVHLAQGGQEQAVLLGRTFLQHVIMIYDGLRAQVTLAR